MLITDRKLVELLEFDPLDNAERATGRSYKDSEETMGLGLLTSFTHNASKAELLKESGDAAYGMEMEPFIALCEPLGFTVVMDEPFLGSSYGGKDPSKERFIVMADKERGALIVTESYGVTGRNTAKLYCQWNANDDSPSFTHSTGTWRDGKFVGTDYPAVEAIALRLRMLDEHGEFVTPWTLPHWLWLLNYSEKGDDIDHKAITESRVRQLPEWVQEMIGPRERVA